MKNKQTNNEQEIREYNEILQMKIRLMVRLYYAIERLFTEEDSKFFADLQSHKENNLDGSKNITTKGEEELKIFLYDIYQKTNKQLDNIYFKKLLKPTELKERN